MRVPGRRRLRALWRERGQSGLAESENLFGSTWPQSEDVLSILVPPERLLHHVSAADDLRREEILAGLERIYGPEPPTRWRSSPATGGSIRSPRGT